MLVSIHQPHYLPWLPYMSKIMHSDLFIALDDVAFTRNGWQNRNKIKTAQGAHTLTVPAAQGSGDPICAVQVPDNGWRRKHSSTVQQAYGRAPFWTEHEITPFYGQPWADFTTPVCAMLGWHLQRLGKPLPMLRSSSLEVQTASTQRLVDLVKKVGGTGYLSGSFALQEYLDPRLFVEAGLELWLFDWKCPEYTQLHGAHGFVPNLATLDALLSVGAEQTLALLQSGAKVRRFE